MPITAFRLEVGGAGDPATSDRMATMDLRLAVGGLLTRNAVLNALLLNYADRLERGCLGHGTETAPCFIVPIWTVDQRPSPPLTTQLLTVEAHTAHDDPSRDENLAIILALVHAVLTDEHASRSITTRRLETSADLVASGLGTAVKVGAWEIALAPSQEEGSAPPRLLPWADYSPVTATAYLPPGSASMN